MYEPSNNEIYTLNPIETNPSVDPLTLIRPDLIEWNSIEPNTLPMFLNDNMLSQYLNAVEPSSTKDYQEEMIKGSIQTLNPRKNEKIKINKKGKESSVENHFVATLDPKERKKEIKDVSKGENPIEAPIEESLYVLPDYYEERSPILIEPTEKINIASETEPKIIHLALFLSSEERT